MIFMKKVKSSICLTYHHYYKKIIFFKKKIIFWTIYYNFLSLDIEKEGTSYSSWGFIL